MSLNPMNLPKLDLYVNDFSGVVASQIVTKYNNLFSEHKNTSGEQIAVVLFPHRQGNTLIDIGVKVFNENGIGEKETNNGLLLIIATEEKKLRIVTGKGMEVEFSDEYCTQIIETELRPLLNTGNYEALLQSWYEISTKKRGPENKKKSDENEYLRSVGKEKNLNTRFGKEKSSKIFKSLFKNILLLFFFYFLIVLLNFLQDKGYINISSNSYNYSSPNSNSSSSSDSWSSSSSDSSSDWGGGSSNGGGGGD